jgi:hypothetical protein
VDFSGAEPRVERHELGLRGCSALDLRGNTAYCAQGTAGYVEVTLGTPDPVVSHRMAARRTCAP